MGVAPRALHGWLPDGTSQNTIFSNKKKTENADNMPDRLAQSQGTWPLSCNAFAIARFLIDAIEKAHISVKTGVVLVSC